MILREDEDVSLHALTVCMCVSGSGYVWTPDRFLSFPLTDRLFVNEVEN